VIAEFRLPKILVKGGERTYEGAGMFRTSFRVNAADSLSRYSRNRRLSNHDLNFADIAGIAE